MYLSSVHAVFSVRCMVVCLLRWWWPCPGYALPCNQAGVCFGWHKQVCPWGDVDASCPVLVQSAGVALCWISVWSAGIPMIIPAVVLWYAFYVRPVWRTWRLLSRLGGLPGADPNSGPVHHVSVCMQAWPRQQYVCWGQRERRAVACEHGCSPWVLVVPGCLFLCPWPCTSLPCCLLPVFHCAPTPCSQL